MSKYKRQLKVDPKTRKAGRAIAAALKQHDYDEARRIIDEYAETWQPPPSVQKFRPKGRVGEPPVLSELKPDVIAGARRALRDSGRG